MTLGKNKKKRNERRFFNLFLLFIQNFLGQNYRVGAKRMTIFLLCCNLLSFFSPSSVKVNVKKSVSLSNYLLSKISSSLIPAFTFSLSLCGHHHEIHHQYMDALVVAPCITTTTVESAI